MKKPFKTGDVVILLTAKNPECKRFSGQIHRLGLRNPSAPGFWRFDPPLLAIGYNQVSWIETQMRHIRDNPGNESFFKAAPLSTRQTTPQGETV